MIQSSTRTMEEMQGRLRGNGEIAPFRTHDGWCSTLASGLGYRYEYDEAVAKGGFDFYRLGNGMCVGLIDLVARQELPRRYASGDYLALTAVLDGNLELTGADGGGELADGFCTVYCTRPDELLETSYPPGQHLRWVTVWLERSTLLHVTGLSARDLPPSVVDLMLHGGHFPCRNVPLSRAASLVAHQMLAPPFAGGYRHAFLTAKGLELACHILFNLSQAVDHEEKGQFSADDHQRLQRAMRLVRANLDEPLNICEMAERVGLRRQRLQQGFRMVYGDTVGRVRTKLRMELALDLIRDSDMSMIEIALETGYDHAASFTRAFKAAFGVSPIQMRYVAQDELRVKHLRRRPAQPQAIQSDL